MRGQNAGPEALERSAGLLRRIADSGNFLAALEPANQLTPSDLGSPSDLTEARNYQAPAAETGLLDAMRRFAWFCREGIGGPGI
jgi:TPR repeat protein